VTEAGDGEDGRIKSAIGIGSLLNDGIGDTIRVSLTEDSVHEIPVAKALVERGMRGAAFGMTLDSSPALSFNPFEYRRRESQTIERDGVRLGGEELVRVVVRRESFEKIAHKIDRMGDYKPEIVYDSAGVREVDPRDDAAIAELNSASNPQFVTVRDDTRMPVIAAFRLLAAKLDARHPMLLKDTFECGMPNVECGVEPDSLRSLLTTATNIGSMLCDGIGDAVLVQGEEAPGQALRLSYNVLQAAGSRIFKTDYVACPSCGRTLFNLQTTTARIKAATTHLKGVKIAIMGCIVNGPGEMADADFGYVGGAPGKVNLYVGKTPVKFNIPETEAVERLQDLIREHGRWVDPVPADAETAAI
jgi:(E)-4-hydroxy-3-methylbut-2-enyl-diphosphate synthase